MKNYVTKEFREGYILGLNSCLMEGFIIKAEKDLLIQAFDNMYEVFENDSNIEDEKNMNI